MNILLADDDNTCRFLLSRIIKLQQEHQLWEARDGAAAWEALRDPAQRFDLAIIDVNMPVLDGIGLAERIRATPKLRSLVLILCTAQNDRQTVDRACLLSVNHYIVKPFTKAVVTEKLNLVASELAARTAIEDVAVVADRLGVDAPTVTELTVNLCKEVRQMLDQARHESQPAVFRKLGVAANGLNGAALSLGLRNLSLELKHIEEAFVEKFAAEARIQFPASPAEIAIEVDAVEAQLAKIDTHLQTIAAEPGTVPA